MVVQDHAQTTPMSLCGRLYMCARGHSPARPFVELELAFFTVFVRVFAGAPARYWILHEQTLPPVCAVIATWLTNAGRRDRDRGGERE